MLSREWEPIVNEMAPVQKLVHLATRMDKVDEDGLRAELLRARRRAYEDELTIQAERVGCPSRKGRLGNGEILTGLNEDSKADAKSIVNTYNYDLASAISKIRTENPRANRYTYASKLKLWEEQRNNWKLPQIAQYTENSARAKAQQDFYHHNLNLTGYAKMQPTEAVCPVCQGWIARGKVPLQVAMEHPGPLHLNCPHLWIVYYKKLKSSECPLLWMGEETGNSKFELQEERSDVLRRPKATASQPTLGATAHVTG